MQLELADIYAPRGCEHGVAMVSERATRTDLSLHLAVADDVDVVLADPLRLKQVILNLLTNAVKFTPSNGRIEARAERVDDEIRVSVEDSGIGIAQSDYERSSSVPARAARRLGLGRGTGLGLTLSKRIVELHGGRLWVNSRIGDGSTFTFSIPDTGTTGRSAGLTRE